VSLQDGTREWWVDGVLQRVEPEPDEEEDR
jgi:hypothetical protein